MLSKISKKHFNQLSDLDDVYGRYAYHQRTIDIFIKLFPNKRVIIIIILFLQHIKHKSKSFVYSFEYVIISL